VLTVALIVTVAVQQGNLDTAIKHLAKNSKTIAFYEIARSLEFLCNNRRKASEV
jgi:hypothetical protein